MTPCPRIFISYRRPQLDRVEPMVRALEAAGIECFLDVDAIDPLADFPARIRQGIARSHALLAWWSTDYGNSDYCMQEFRLAWQHARRQSSDTARRVWVLNPETDAGHIHAGESNRQNYLKPPAAGGEAAWVDILRQRLAALLPEGQLADERVASPATHRFGTPTPTSSFTGRGGELMRIHSRLFPPRVGNAGAAVAVQTHGLGGVGKTELAAAYAADFADAYPGGIYWLNLASWRPTTPTTEEEGQSAWLGALAQALRHYPVRFAEIALDAEGKPCAPAVVRERLQAQLEARGDFLWVLDNLPDISPEEARRHLLDFLRAPGVNGRTLVTTRDSRPADGFAVLPLHVMSEEDAIRLLWRLYQEGRADLPAASDDERRAMADLVVETGAHTLALVLLGKYAQTAVGGYVRVLERLRANDCAGRIEEIADLLAEAGEQARSVVACFALSLEALGNDARELLGLASLCAPNQAISEGLLFDAFGGQAREDGWNQALRELLRASLLARRAGPGKDEPPPAVAPQALPSAVCIHPLVAAVAVGWLAVDAPTIRARLVAALLPRVSDTLNIASHERIADDIEQARYLGERVDGEDGICACLRVGQYELARGRFALAQSLTERAHNCAMRVLGGEHSLILAAMGNLATTRRVLGDLEGAFALEEDVLAVRRRVSGDEHPDTLTAMGNLAITLAAKGDLAGARALAERTLAVRRRVLGDEHPDTLTAMNNLAGALRDQGDLAGARMLQEQALAVCRRLFGEEHPTVLTATNNLAGLLRDQGDLAGARSLQEQGLAVCRRVFGEEHPTALTAMNNLALTLGALGELAAARALEERTLAIRRRVLGNEHPETLTSISNLANSIGAQGDLAGARALQEQALAIRRRVLGDEHPETLTSMGGLASTLWAQGNLAQARILQEQALAACRRVLGDEHPDTLILQNNLTLTLRAQGDLTGARGLQEQALAVSRRVLGDAHPATLTAMGNLAITLWAQGDLAQAQVLQESALVVSRSALGDAHADTMTAMNNLAGTLAAQGDLEGARVLLEQALAVRRRVQGERHPDTSVSAGNLCFLLLKIGDPQSALKIFAECLAWLLSADPESLSAGQRDVRTRLMEVFKRVPSEPDERTSPTLAPSR